MIIKRIGRKTEYKTREKKVLGEIKINYDLSHKPGPLYASVEVTTQRFYTPETGGIPRKEEVVKRTYEIPLSSEGSQKSRRKISRLLSMLGIQIAEKDIRIKKQNYSPNPIDIKQ